MPTPVNLLYVHSSDELYGADKILLQLVERLDKEQFQPIVVLPTDIPTDRLLSAALAARNIETVHLNTAVLRRQYFTPLGMPLYLMRLIISTVALCAIILRRRVGLVHSNSVAVIPGALAACLTRTPHIWHIHEILVEPRLLWRVTSWLVPRLSSQVVAVSNPVRDHLCAGNARNQEKAIVIHNGIDLNRFELSATIAETIREEWGVRADQRIVGMVGRISHWKGQDHFLVAARHVAAAPDSVRFVLVGSPFAGQEQRMVELAQTATKYGIADRVIFNDFRADIPAVLAAFDIFVLPSTLPDPFPTVILEAMAAAKPIIANAHGGSLEMVENNRTGLLVDPGDPRQMAQAIDQLLQAGKATREIMGQRGRARLEELFSLGAFVARWTTLYNTSARRR